jgi:two-component system chemotaxis response regulator CheB
MNLSPFGKLLDLNSDWKASGPDAGMIQFLGRDGAIAGLATFSQKHLERDLERISGQIAGNFSGVKIVCAREIRMTVERFCEKKKWSVLKVVEREDPFEVQFLAKDKKLFVSREEPKIEQKIEQLTPAKIVKILIVDDSPTIRKVLEKIFTSDPDVNVVGSVGLPSEVEAAIEKTKPDVITLDIHLPEMNGVDLLKKYLGKYPIPTIMISSISMEEGPLVLNALEAGAVDYIQKPSSGEISTAAPMILAKVKAAAGSKVRLPGVANFSKKLMNSISAGMDSSRLLAIGSSTGGTEALKEVFLRLPKDIPPTVVVQHIPAVFSKAFADRLNEICPFTVVEGKDGEEVTPGKVIIAPGGTQMKIKRTGKSWRIIVDDSPPVNRHKPSVDYLFDSVVAEAGASAVGVILTGMGADGAKGLKKMHELGCHTIAQNQETCVVYGMPQAAVKLGAVTQILPLQGIADELVKEFSKLKKKAV